MISLLANLLAFKRKQFLRRGMTSLFTHPAVPLAIALVAPRGAVGSRLLWAGVLACLLPDADVIGFHFGIAYGSEYGHRGFTHSLLFAVIVAFIAAACAKPLRTNAWTAFLFVALSCASHPLLDMLTHGAKGVALFWPFDTARVSSPFAPIPAAPMSAPRFFTFHGWQVFRSELMWLWLPLFVLAFTLRFRRR